MTRQVDLLVTKSQSASSVVAASGSGNLIYTVTVSNSGPSDASGITLSEATTLESGVSVGTVVASAGSFSGSNGTGTWTLGTLAAGHSAILTLTLTVSAAAAPGNNVIGDTATLTAVNETNTDSPANQTASVTTSVAPNLKISETIVPSIIYPGSTFAFAITITNIGATTVTGLQLPDTLPTNAKFLGTTSIAGSLAGGHSETVLVEMQVPSATKFGTAITNMVSVQDAQAGAINLATTTLTVDVSAPPISRRWLPPLG